MWGLWIALGLAAAPSLADSVALHLGVDGRVVDQATVGAAYDAACEAGSDLACKWRSWDDFGAAQLSDLWRIAGLSCEQDDAEACLVAALSIGIDGSGEWNADASADPTQAAVLVQKACDAGVARGCLELGTLLQLGFALPTEPEQAKERFEQACDAGIGVGCLRRAAVADDPAPWRDKAAALGEPAVLDSGGACAAGVVAACETRLGELEGADQVPVLESLCRMRTEHCPALATARAAHAPGPSDDLPTRDPDRAWTQDGGVLVGWRGATWGPHVWFSSDQISAVRIRVSGPRHEVVEVALKGIEDGDGVPRVLVLPGESCGTVDPQIRGLGNTHLARAVDEGGLPMASDCLDAIALGDRPEYFTGMLAVDAENTDFAREARALRVRASDSSEDLFTCGGAVDREVLLDPLVLQVVVKRGGKVSKVKVEKGSGDDGFDACVTEWLLSLDPVDDVDLTTKLQLTTRLLW